MDGKLADQGWLRTKALGRERHGESGRAAHELRCGRERDTVLSAVVAIGQRRTLEADATPYLREKPQSRGSPPSGPIRWSQRRLDTPSGFRSDLAHVGPGCQGHTNRAREPHMKHVRVATYEIKQGSFQEIADVAQDGMLRTFQEQPGFIRYGLADLGDKTCLSLSLWETRKDAEAAVPVAANWVRENLERPGRAAVERDRRPGLLRGRSSEGLTDRSRTEERRSPLRWAPSSLEDHRPALSHT